MVSDYSTTIHTLQPDKVNWKQYFLSTTFRVVLLVMLFVVGALYLIQMSSVSTKGFAISDLQKQTKSLKEEVRSLQVQIAENRSMESIQNRLKNTDLVVVSDIKYINALGTEVARR